MLPVDLISLVTMYLQERKTLAIKWQPSKKSETGRCLMGLGVVFS